MSQSYCLRGAHLTGTNVIGWSTYRKLNYINTIYHHHSPNDTYARNTALTRKVVHAVGYMVIGYVVGYVVGWLVG